MKHTVWIALCLIAAGVGVGAVLRPEMSVDAFAGAPDRETAASASRQDAEPRHPAAEVDTADSGLASTAGARAQGARLASAIDPGAPIRPAPAKRIDDPLPMHAETLDADVVEIGAFLSADIMGGLSYGIETDDPRDIGIPLDADRPWGAGAVNELSDDMARSLGRRPTAPRPLSD